jgi:hypothetical protein
VFGYSPSSQQSASCIFLQHLLQYILQHLLSIFSASSQHLLSIFSATSQHLLSIFSASSQHFFIVNTLLYSNQFVIPTLFAMTYQPSRERKIWRSPEQKLQRSYNSRKNTLVRMVAAINQLPNTRFGLYGEHSGKWIKVEPDENFFRDTGFMIRASESVEPGYTEPTPPPLFRDMPSPPSFRPLSLINLTEDIFSDA